MKNDKQLKKEELFDSKGYLIHLIGGLHKIEGAAESKEHLEEVEKTIDEIIRISVELCMDYPNILKELKIDKQILNIEKYRNL